MHVHTRQPSPLGLRAFSAHLRPCREIWVTADEAGSSVTPCSTPRAKKTWHLRWMLLCQLVGPVGSAPEGWRLVVQGEWRCWAAGSASEGLQHRACGCVPLVEDPGYHFLPHFVSPFINLLGPPLRMKAGGGRICRVSL